MKKILICSYQMHIGGIEKALINLLKNIDYSQYQVDLILYKKEGILLKEIPAEVNIKEFKSSKSKIPLIRKISNFFTFINFYINNKNKYYMSISYTTYDNVGSRLARIASNNSTLFVHSNYYEVYKSDLDKINDFFNKVSFDKFNRLVFVSNEAKEGFLKVFNTNQNLEVINNLVDYESIISKSKEKIDFDKSKTNLIYVGRLSEEDKAVSRLINLMKGLDNSVLHIVGSGPDEKEYIEKAKELKLVNIVFYGFQENPYKYMNIADYIILSSNYEGFPVIYNEAIVLNKQVITTIDTSDDVYKASDNFFVISKENFIDEVSEIIKTKKVKKYKKYDFNEINRKRMLDILEK